ncbi:SRPBCC family protein [Sporichthya polymorpha]|uniref:SRPBCC family protein n=1 Tax=Sporichthya polymorpha TaxID=35751 RepID=UPI00036477E5|nr:SRPBCC family protein [Sporichthya polymorpha]
MSDQLRVSRDVDASAEQIFAVLADPARHPEIDGAGMVLGLAAGGPVSAVGDEFTMNMNNSILDDYQVTSRVTAFEPGRRIGWSPCGLAGDTLDRLGDMKPGGQTFTFELEPNSSGGTTVTQIYDWSAVEDPQFRALMPFLKEEHLAGTLDKLSKVAG